jgi:hypothetical protein
MHHGRFLDPANAEWFLRKKRVRNRFSEEKGGRNGFDAPWQLSHPWERGMVPDPFSSTSLPTIHVVQHEGQHFTLDNRRLVTFQNAGLDEIPIQRVPMTDPAVAREFVRKFNPIEGGTKIIITPNSDRPAAVALLRQMGKIK